jgi:hypothetical protein
MVEHIMKPGTKAVFRRISPPVGRPATSEAMRRDSRHAGLRESSKTRNLGPAPGDPDSWKKRSIPRPKPVEGRRQRGDGSRGLILVFSILGLVALSTSITFALPSLLRVRSVEVHGNISLAAADVVSFSLVTPGAALLSVDTARVEAALEAWPPVAAARATRIFPSRLRIDIVERRPVALVLAEIRGRNGLVAIDVSGIAYCEVQPASLPDVPVLSGLRFADFRPGQRLPDSLRPALASFAAIQESDPALLSLFSEIRIEESRFGEVELVLFPLHRPIPIRTGSVLKAETLRSIVLVLDALASRGMGEGIREIDFRTGTIVFRTKEAHSG